MKPVLPQPIRPVAPIDISNPTRLFTWLVLIQGHVLGALDAADDLLRSPSKRKLTRAVTKERLALGRRNFLRLVDAAKLAIPKGTPLMVHDPDADPPSTDPSRDE